MTIKPIRIAIIGTLPPPIGGTSVLLQTLVDALRNRADVQLIVINTSGIRGRGLRGLMQYASTVRRIGRAAREADVLTLHAATGGMLALAPAVLAIGRVLGRPVVLRSFGGTYYGDGFGFIRRALMRFVLRRADLYLAETKMMIRQGQLDGIRRLVWYPNSRPLDGTDTTPTESGAVCRKFVFISHVRPVKGVREIIEAGEQLDSATVDVYGPFLDGMSERDFAGLKTVRYLGVVPPPEVVRTLEQYDALLLPSYHTGEGYPGIVLEAYRAGLPVITTRWRAIPEIVDETCGILIEPRRTDQLLDAMRMLVDDPALYAKLRRGVQRQRRLFDSRVWADAFVRMCRTVASGGVASAETGFPAPGVPGGTDDSARQATASGSQCEGGEGHS